MDTTFLTNVFGSPDKEEVRQSMDSDCTNDFYCLRIGRAMLTGRLHAFIGDRRAFDGNPVYETDEENEAYAMGYQIDDAEPIPSTFGQLFNGLGQRNGNEAVELANEYTRLTRLCQNFAIMPVGKPATISDIAVFYRVFELRTDALFRALNQKFMQEHELGQAPQMSSLKEILAKLQGE